MKTIAGRILRDLGRKLDLQGVISHVKVLEICRKILLQKRGSSNKIYSLHEPEE